MDVAVVTDDIISNDERCHDSIMDDFDLEQRAMVPVFFYTGGGVASCGVTFLSEAFRISASGCRLSYHTQNEA